MAQDLVVGGVPCFQTFKTVLPVVRSSKNPARRPERGLVFQLWCFLGHWNDSRRVNAGCAGLLTFSQSELLFSGGNRSRHASR